MAAQGRSSPSTDPSATDPTSPGGASRTGETPRAARGRRRRLDTVLDLVIDNGHISVEALVAQLGISPATARRDLDALADQQLVIRSHGGASANPDSSSLPLRYRAARNAGQKEAIAAAAVDLVRPGSVIGLNGGTTTTALAHELASRQDFRDCERATVLVTNAVNIAQELAVRRHLQLVVTGGVVRESSYELVGTWAEQMLAQIRIDTMFIGVNALNATDGAGTHDESEASISSRLIERSTRVVVVADHTKIGADAFARIGSPEIIDDLVTDSAADPAVLDQLREAGIAVHIAEEGG
ncbi:MAG TPA: DeoR/GlpR family DNA-binding transcription regulator [Candidatus Brachybacterium merdavium]|uniref:DeoR/GlpR family DNA-binding transcription regulator n=1 Tax=Candidatus Brachybacterium merdavium TaxID=2838513 RepID=A0A9D2LAZ0_9MICO|nr:DeoR/GlpR family DNA-binding transcription regulator [Candidatus Brachybacterium merdavium]